MIADFHLIVAVGSEHGRSYWMYDRHSGDRSGWRQEFLLGVEEFITFATSQVHLIDKEKIKCSCVEM